MSFVDKLEFLESKIYNIMRENVDKIKSGYKIINYEMNKISFYACSKIICNNGFTGTIWDIEEPMKKDLEEYKQSIAMSGFSIDNLHYFIDLNKINIHDFDVSNIEVILIK